MKALLIGGTGTISTSITRLLVETGWEVTLLNRGNKPLPQGAMSLQGDIHDEAAVAAAVEGRYFDVVADFIAFAPEDVERDYRLFQGKCSQYIGISSASAYQKPLLNYLVTESTPLANPHWHYSRQKIACEEAMMRHYRADGFPITIVRPSYTYNENSLPLAVHGSKGPWQLARRLLDGKPIIIQGDGTSLWTFTDSRDFARAFVGLMGNPHAIGEAVQITSDETLTWDQAYTAFAAALGVPLKAVHISSDFLIEAGRKAGYDFEGSLIGDKSVSVVFDNTKLKRLVPGFTATIRFDEGIRRSVANHLATPALQREDPEFDAFCEQMLAARQKALDMF